MRGSSKLQNDAQIVDDTAKVYNIVDKKVITLENNEASKQGLKNELEEEGYFDELTDSELSTTKYDVIIKELVHDLYGIYRGIKDRLKTLVKIDLDEKKEELNFVKYAFEVLDNQEISDDNIVHLTDEAISIIYELSRKKIVENVTFTDIIEKSLYLNLFSIFDEFIGKYLKTTYLLKPELIENSEKEVKIADVFKHGSLESFLISVIEKEIENFRRKSYIEQFETLEKKLNMGLKKFKNWPIFVEICQRRNILMHCGGIVSEQYIKICKENKCSNIPEKDTILKIDRKYLEEAVLIIMEVAIKLTIVTWHKLFKDTSGKCEETLNELLFTFLIEEEYELATIIGEFAISLPNITNKEKEIIFIVNLCIAYKSLNETEKLKECINKVDWTPLSNEFKLARNILCDEIEKIDEDIIKIGTHGKYFGKHNYIKFPLFRFVINNEKFRKGFEEVFNINYEEFIKAVSYKIIDDQELKIEDEISDIEEEI